MSVSRTICYIFSVRE